jgi:ornithine--oxo-acid transaminase
VRFLPFGEPTILDDFFAAHGPELAAAVLEPVQGDAGILVPPPGYLRRLADLCRRHEALLVADEVLTFAKTGRLLAMHDDRGPIPTDVTVIGKSLGFGAVPAAMVIARRELAVRPSGAVATCDLRPLTCAVIDAGLRHVAERRLVERAGPLGEELRAGLREVATECGDVFAEVRGVGLLNGVELTEKAAQTLPALRRRLIEAGVFVEFMAGAGRRSLGQRYLFPAMRVAPPLTITDAELRGVVEAIRDGARTFRRELR